MSLVLFMLAVFGHDKFTLLFVLGMNTFLGDDVALWRERGRERGAELHPLIYTGTDTTCHHVLIICANVTM